MNAEIILLADAPRDVWLAERRKGIASSDSPQLLGVSDWGTPIDVWLDKRALAFDRAMTRRIRRGLALEPVISAEYEEETGRRLSVPPKLIRSSKHAWMLASLDRLRDDGAIVELKYSERKSEWGESGTDEVPPQYLIQAQHQLAASGAELCEIVAWLPDELRIFPIARHEPLIALIVESGAEMWERVQRGEMPPLDWAHPKTAAAISHAYGVRDGWEIDLDGDAEELVAEFLRARDAESASKSAKDVARAKLLLAMGEAAGARLPDGTLLTRRKVSRREYVCKATKFIQFRVRTQKGDQS